MRKNELELIAALAEGTLEDESDALALVESSPEHRAEYEAQKAALAALRSVGPAALTEAEKSALHRDVWTQLTAQPTAAAKTPWYYRLAFGGAAVVVVVAGVLAVLNQGGADDAGTAAFEEVAEDLSQGEAESAAPLAGDGADIEQADTTEAAATDEGLADEPGFSYFADVADRYRLQSTRAMSSDDDSFTEENASCLTRADLDGYVAIGLLEVADAKAAGLDAESPYLVAVPEGAEIDDATPVAFVETGTCLLVHLDE